MRHYTIEWICDECGKKETMTTFDKPNGWDQITRPSGNTVEFCSHAHYVQWVMKKPKEERDRWPHTGLKVAQE